MAIEIKKTKKKSDRSKYSHCKKMYVLVNKIFSNSGVNIFFYSTHAPKIAVTKKVEEQNKWKYSPK